MVTRRPLLSILDYAIPFSLTLVLAGFMTGGHVSLRFALGAALGCGFLGLIYTLRKGSELS